eukprot:Gregarina_sp_Poly_1__6000@NODE_315_length_9587_cov_683_543592_g270_i0_p12_GENE_NODE_315_length_9587_cov_683_543592_g270_i0NODE_315_length_9587_cov_683_543592_g270_i0_p12_ORF_typecomplete_len102_score1_45_NODE_315_length_9587_cov_683_543592_g270_i0387692
MLSTDAAQILNPGSVACRLNDINSVLISRRSQADKFVVITNVSAIALSFRVLIFLRRKFTNISKRWIALSRVLSGCSYSQKGLCFLIQSSVNFLVLTKPAT